jgi:isoleucyl-tRNA synthetase
MELADVLAEEMNVKEIEVVAEVGELVSYRLMANNRTLGPKFGKLFPQIKRALDSIDAAEAAQTLQSGRPLSLRVNGEAVELSDDDVLVLTESKGDLAVASDKGVTVAVDTVLTPELIQEGYARDIVRHVNNLRKDAGLEISDRIALAYQASDDVAAAFTGFGDFIAQETLATELTAVAPSSATYHDTVSIGDQDVTLTITKQ